MIASSSSRPLRRHKKSVRSVIEHYTSRWCTALQQEAGHNGSVVLHGQDTAGNEHYWGHTVKQKVKVGCVSRVGQNHIFICIYGVHTVFMAGTSPYIQSYTVCIYGSGQPCA